MKQRSQINILHKNKQLHYMVELHDEGSSIVTHGLWSYRNLIEGFDDGVSGFISDNEEIRNYTRCVQFIRNKNQDNEYDTRNISNTLRNINTWIVNDGWGVNLYVPEMIEQRQMTLYIPRYSIESFQEDLKKVQASDFKYIITAYTYISGIKVILGGYIFDLSSSRATNEKVRYKTEEYPICVDFDILDPTHLVYDDKWKQFRTIVCGENEYTNNTGSVICVDIEPVIQGEGDYYIRTSEFTGGIINIPFEFKANEFLHADLKFTGDAWIDIRFNDVYEGDLQLYLAETYGLWKVNENDEYELDDDGNRIPQTNKMVFELIIKDDENIYDQHAVLTDTKLSHIFSKNEISKSWGWYKDGLIMQGSVEIYDVSDMDPESTVTIEELRTTHIPVICILTNEVPLNKETYRFLTKTEIPFDEIDLNQIDMIDYNVNVVNKINKNVINVNRPENYKSNIVHPVFIRTNPQGSIVIHPAVTENIAIDLNKYKSLVDLFYLRVEGVDFIEIGRTPTSIVFGVDGHLLPNKVIEGMAYILNNDRVLVTTIKYKYEQ